MCEFARSAVTARLVSMLSTVLIWQVVSICVVFVENLARG